MTQCKYKRIGCPWQGPYHELTVHEAECTHPTKTGNELMEILDEMDQTRKKEMQLYNSIFSLLSFEKIGYTGNGSVGATATPALPPSPAPSTASPPAPTLFPPPPKNPGGVLSRAEIRLVTQRASPSALAAFRLQPRSER